MRSRRSSSACTVRRCAGAEEVEVVLSEQVGDLEDRVAAMRRLTEHLLFGRLVVSSCFSVPARASCTVLMEQMFTVNQLRNL